MSGKQRRDIRALAAETGLSHADAAREHERRRAQPCTVPGHLQPDGSRTAGECEDRARQAENAGGTGQRLRAVKADHRREPLTPSVTVQAGLASGASEVRPAGQDQDTEDKD